jgi:hypothetical protein
MSTVSSFVRVTVVFPSALKASDMVSCFSKSPPGIPVFFEQPVNTATNKIIDIMMKLIF